MPNTDQADSEPYTVLAITGKTGKLPGEFLQRAGGDVCQKNGDLYVADLGNKRIQVFDKDLNIKSEFPTLPTAAGPFDVAVSLDCLQIGVVDLSLPYLQFFNEVGEQINKVGAIGRKEGQFMNPRAVAVDAETGYWYVADMSRVQVFKPDGTYVTQFGS